MRQLLIILLCASLAGCSASKKSNDEPSSEKTSSSTSGVSTAAEEVAEVEAATVSEDNESAAEEIWVKRDPFSLPDLERRVSPDRFDAYSCDYEQVTRMLDEDEVVMTLPTRQGMTSFQLQNATTMNPELAAKFPNIRSYKGKSADGKLSVRLDTNDEGLFAEISGVERNELIAPLLKGSRQYYAVYSERDAPPGTPRNDDFH